MGPLEWALLLALSLLWGGSFFFTAVAVRELPPLTLVVLRIGLAALLLLAAMSLTGRAMSRAPAARRAFLGIGLLNNAVPFVLIVWAQTQIESGLASILNATTPLATVLVAHLYTRNERLTVNRLIGVLIALLGVVVMVGPQALAGLGIGLVAQLACLAAAVSYACAGVFRRRFRCLGIKPLQTAAGQVTASALLLLPVALAVDRPWDLAMPGPLAWAAVLGLAALSTALAYVVYFRILATAGATNLLLVTFLISVSAILLGVTVLDERLEPLQLLGMALIAMGLAAIDGRLLRWAPLQPAMGRAAER
jgi:drug/metabolite transporter (DMT)-like permease